MDALSQKLGKAITQKSRLLALIESKNLQNNLGLIENKEQNFKNIQKVQDQFQKQEQQLSSIRDGVKAVGSSIQEGMSQERMRLIEAKEREKEAERSAKDKETQEFINSLKEEVHLKEAELNKLQSELSKMQLQLNNQKEGLDAQNKQQSSQLSKMDTDFTESINEKEKQLQALLKQLAELKAQIKEERRRCEQLEEAEDELEEERTRLVGEVERRDEEAHQLKEGSGTAAEQQLVKSKLDKDSEELQRKKKEALDSINKQADSMKDQEAKNKLLLKQVNQLEEELKKLNSDNFDLDDLQLTLQKMLDDEKKLFDQNLDVVQKLKDVEVNSQESTSQNSNLEEFITLLTDQNYVERKSRAVEVLLRQYEDKIRDKKSQYIILSKKIQRIDDLVKVADDYKDFGLDGLKVKFQKMDLDFKQLEGEAGALRAKKVKYDTLAMGKDFKEITDSSIKQCLTGLRELEKEVDLSIQRQNDILVIDRLNKVYNDCEKDIGVLYSRKGRTLKENVDKRQIQLMKKMQTVVDRTIYIEVEIIPDVIKIADSESKIEVLEWKQQLLKDINQTGQDLIDIDVENSQSKLHRIYSKKDELMIISTFESIGRLEELKDLELEFQNYEKDGRQLEKILQDFELDFKQLELELKGEYLEKIVKESKKQELRVKDLDNKLAQLNDGIKQIEDSILQAQSAGGSDSAKEEEIRKLQEHLQALKDLRNIISKDKRELARDGQILKGDIDSLILEDATPGTLENLEQEVVKQREAMNNSEKQINDALNKMAKVKEDALAVAFKRKSDKRSDCKAKLKKVIDNANELERLLKEIGNQLDLNTQDVEYLKESEFSPTKGRPSSTTNLFLKGDFQVDLEVNQQKKELEKLEKQFYQLQQDKEGLKKQIQSFSQKFNSLPLEDTTFLEFEQFYDSISPEMEDKSSHLVKTAQKLLDPQLKQQKEIIEDLIQMFKQKRQILADCRKEQQDKSGDLMKVESQTNNFKLRISQLEKAFLNQQSMNFITNSEKKTQSVQLTEDLNKIKQKVGEKQSEIDKMKVKLSNITKDIEMVGHKVVTVDELKQIYKVLQDLNRLSLLKDELRVLGDCLTTNENEVEKLIKDTIEGSLYECERKIKETETIIDKMTKKIIELNNGINDFDVDIKKALQGGSEVDGDIQTEARLMAEENLRDRRKLRDLEDQKIVVKKVIQKIKSAIEIMNEGDHSKKSEAGDGQALEDFVAEIETCLKKVEVHYKVDICELIEPPFLKRKEDWGKKVFQNEEKKAIVEDVERTYSDLEGNIQDLDNKIKDIEKMIRGFQEVTKAMTGNPDYEHRQASIIKLIESTKQSLDKTQQIQSNREELIRQFQKIQSSKLKGLKSLSLEQLQQLAKAGEDMYDQLTSQLREADIVQKDLQKMRQKLGDADIIDNFKERVERLNEIDSKIKDIKHEEEELTYIMQESLKISLSSSKEAIQQQLKIQHDLEKANTDKQVLQERLNELRERMNMKDFNQDDPVTFPIFIQEIKNLRGQLQQVDSQLNNLSQHMKFLKNKYGGVDIIQKLQSFLIGSQDQTDHIHILKEELEALRSLQEEFDGYASDNEEEEFVDRVGGDIKDSQTRIEIAEEEVLQINMKTNQAQKLFQGRADQGDQTSLTLKEIEERAALVAQLEEDQFKNKKLLDQIDSRLQRDTKTFMSMQTKEKLRRRNQELIELSKRLDMFAEQATQSCEDMQNEASKIHAGADGSDKLVLVFAEMIDDIQNVKQEYDNVGQDLLQIEQELNELKESQIHQFDVLKGNIRIKKRILNDLNLIKKVRQQDIQIKSKYEANKPQKQFLYRATKGDFIDQLIADWVNNNSCPVPIKRLGGGYYMFGTKKIYAKIINGKLVIRVGGGYMGIDEFMYYYGASELNKMLAYNDIDENDELDLDQAMDVKNDPGDLIKHRTDGKSVIGIKQMKKRLSPRQPSPGQRQGSPNPQMPIRKSVQSTSSPKASWSNRNNMRVGSGRAKDVEGRMAGRKSPNPSSFLKQNTQKKGQEDQNESFNRIQMNIKEKKQGQ